MITTKDGVEFSCIAPGGFRILSAIEQASDSCALDLVITSGTDGAHSGPNDPHHRGEAYDVRSHNLTAQQKTSVLNAVMATLGWDRFYGFIENPDMDTEHFHFQVKKGTEYP